MHARTKRLRAKIRTALSTGCQEHPEGLTATEVSALGRCNAFNELQMLIWDGEVEREKRKRAGLVSKMPQYLYTLTTKGMSVLKKENADE